MEKKSKVFFQPWIGPDYDKDGFEGKRVLVLGHSYPCNESSITQTCENCGDKPLKSSCCNATIDSINEYFKGELEKPHASTFRSFEKALTGKEDTNVWNKLLFYNYIQKGFISKEDKRTGKCPMSYYRFSFEPLVNVLMQHQPQYVIVWGRLNHDFIIKFFKDNGYKVESFNDGNDFVYEKIEINNFSTYFLRMQHPSQGYNPSHWNERINKFLSL